MNLLALAVGLVLAAGLLSYVGVPYAGILAVFGVVLFVIWLFQKFAGTGGTTRIR